MSESKPQLSLAVGGVQVTAVSHFISGRLMTISVGQSLISGGKTSRTSISKEQTAVLPDTSVALYSTKTFPGRKTAPGATVDCRDCTAQLSLAVGGVQFIAVSHFVDGRSTVREGGQSLNTGGTSSLTVTINAQVALLLEASVAVYTTVWRPMGINHPTKRSDAALVRFHSFREL